MTDAERALLASGFCALLFACGEQPQLAADGGAGDVATLDDASAASLVRVRLMAGNLTSGNSQTYDPGEGIRIFQGLQPDVAMIQEFNYGTSSTTDIRTFVDTAFGTQFSYVRGPANQIPNGVISRFPILASGDWTDPQVSNRDFVWARIDVPGPHELLAVSVHLLTTGATARDAEATALVGVIQQNAAQGDYLVVAGDFNTASRAEPCVTTMSQITAASGPYPADQASNENTNAPRNYPHDWVLASPPLDALAVPVVIGANSFPHGLVFDSRVYAPLADVPPVLQTDSAATNMQHMGVVRDFELSP